MVLSALRQPSQQMVHLSVAEEGSWGKPSSPNASPGARSCTISSGGCPHACICTPSSSRQVIILRISCRAASCRLDKLSMPLSTGPTAFDLKLAVKCMML